MLSGILKESLGPVFKKMEKRERFPLMVVGLDVVVLLQRYDANQHWFDFMRGIIFEPHPPAPEKVENLKKPRITKFARVPEHCMKLFLYAKGTEQICLPFPDRLRISANQLQVITRANFPGWDKLHDGTVPYVHFNRDRKVEVEEWCLQNCVGFYAIGRDSASFQHAKEYILARMMFGEN